MPFQEDPYEDMKHLQIGPEDKLLVITSAGDNALHYAIAGNPKEVSILLQKKPRVVIKHLPDTLC